MDKTLSENMEQSMKYYCRVCAVNTKTKKSKPENSVGIFTQTGLKSLMEKYLQMQILEDDLLPKVICNVCHGKIESIEMLRVIAKRTETLLMGFIKDQQSETKPGTQFQNVYNTFAISKHTPRILKSVEDIVPMSDAVTKNINNKKSSSPKRRESVCHAFNPAQISRHAVTSSPIMPPPVTIVHQMPTKKLPTLPVQKKRKIERPHIADNQPVLPISTSYQVPIHQGHQRHKNFQVSDKPAVPQNLELYTMSNNLGNGMPLGSIIKDEDLLRLILKALKWPFNNQTIDIQIQRLKSTNFNDIIVDPNLLQDTDLIQILGPLISPNLPPLTNMAQQQQTFHITVPQETMAIPQATMSYKLPAETSVQIITVPPEIVEKPHTHQHKSSSSRNRISKRKQAIVKTSQQQENDMIIIVSDESDNETSNIKKDNTDIQNFDLQLDPALYPGVGENSNSNDALLASLNRKREAMMRYHHKRKQTLTKNMEMVDDIMIVDEGVQMNEPYPEVVLVKKPKKSHDTMMPSLNFKPKSRGIMNSAPTNVIHQNREVASATVSRKLPTLLPKHHQTTSEDRKPTMVHRIPKGFNMKNLSDQKPSTSLEMSTKRNFFKRPTLADADSTTKIVIKEKKIPKPRIASPLDIEEQINKVRIGKQVQNPICKKTVNDNDKNALPSDDEVLILVEYEGEEEQFKKEKIKDPISLSVDKEHTAINSKRKNTEKENSVQQKPTLPTPVAELNVKEKPKLPTIDRKERECSKVSAIKIKEESNTEVEIKAEQLESSECNNTIKAEDENEDNELSKSSQRSFAACKTSDLAISTRSIAKKKTPQKKEDIQQVVTTFRPARKSKTLSKYYKGPALPTASKLEGRSDSKSDGRSMRSRN